MYNPQHKFVAYLRSKGITPQAYSPLGSTGSPLLKDETACAIAAAHGLQPADVLLGWLVAKGIVVLAKSVTPARIKANIDGALAAADALSARVVSPARRPRCCAPRPVAAAPLLRRRMLPASAPCSPDVGACD